MPDGIGNELEKLFGTAVDKAAAVDVINNLVLGILLAADEPARAMRQLHLFQGQALSELFLDCRTVVIHVLDPVAQLLHKLVGHLHVIRRIVFFDVAMGALNRKI